MIAAHPGWRRRAIILAYFPASVAWIAVSLTSGYYWFAPAPVGVAALVGLGILGKWLLTAAFTWVRWGVWCLPDNASYNDKRALVAVKDGARKRAREHAQERARKEAARRHADKGALSHTATAPGGALSRPEKP